MDDRSKSTQSSAIEGKIQDAVLLLLRFRETGCFADLELGIEELEHLSDADMSNIALQCDLGIAYMLRHETLKDTYSLELGILCFDLSLELAESGDCNDELLCALLINSLNAKLMQAELTGNGQDIPLLLTTLSRLRKRLKPASRVIAAINIATTLLERYEQTNAGALIDEALDLLNEALIGPASRGDLARGKSQLAKGLRFKHDLHPTVETYNRAVLAGLEALSEVEKHAIVESIPTAVSLGEWAFRRSDWPVSATAFVRCSRSMQRVLRGQTNDRDKITMLTRFHDVPTRAAYAVAKQGGFADAMILAEMGRAFLLSDQILRRQVEQGKTGDLQKSEQVLNLTTEPSSPMPQLRDFEDVSRDVPLVYLVDTAVGSVALILYRGAFDVIWMDSITTELLDRTIYKYFEALDSSNPLLGIDHVAQWCWDVIIGQLLQRLVNCRCTNVVACGRFALLPLQTAYTIEDSRHVYAIDQLAIACLPSMSCIGRISTQTQFSRPLVVIDPQPSGKVPLAGATVEATAVERYFGAPVSVLKGSNATAAAFTAAAASRPRFIHFAGHAATCVASPFDSQMIFAGRPLTAGEILDAPSFRTKCVILSACETGRIGDSVPDEMFGLTMTFLAAGAEAVIASSWRVSDVATAVLITLFYANLARHQSTLLEALVEAQRVIREMTAQSAMNILNELEGEPSLQTAMLLGPLERLSPNARPFSNPYFWGAFAMYGSGCSTEAP